MHKPSGTILVAVDGSLLAKHAALAAIKLAHVQGYGIHALYVVDEALALASYADYRQELTFELEEEDDGDPLALLEAQGAFALEEVVGMAEEAGVPYETEMLLGNVEDMILDRANQAFMVAIGRRGNRHADKPQQLGAHFWQVVHKARVPVLAGGEKVPQKVKRMMFVFTGDERSIKALHGVTVLQRDLKAEVVVIFAANPTDQQAEAWQNQVLARLSVEDRPYYRFIRRPERRADALVAAAEEEDVDLLVMSYVHRQLPILEDIRGMPLDKVLKRTQLPVIIVR